MTMNEISERLAKAKAELATETARRQKWRPAKLKVQSFSGGIRTRVKVTSGDTVVGELTRMPRSGWHDGPANTYRFHPNEEGFRIGLHEVGSETTIRAIIAKATA